jgi:hypothetical protein
MVQSLWGTPVLSLLVQFVAEKGEGPRGWKAVVTGRGPCSEVCQTWILCRSEGHVRRNRYVRAQPLTLSEASKVKVICPSGSSQASFDPCHAGQGGASWMQLLLLWTCHIPPASVPGVFSAAAHLQEGLGTVPRSRVQCLRCKACVKVLTAMEGELLFGPAISENRALMADSQEVVAAEE